MAGRGATLVVDEHGLPQRHEGDAHALGLGLDQKAIEAVSKVDASSRA